LWLQLLPLLLRQLLCGVLPLHSQLLAPPLQLSWLQLLVMWLRLPGLLLRLSLLLPVHLLLCQLLPSLPPHPLPRRQLLLPLAPQTLLLLLLALLLLLLTRLLQPYCCWPRLNFELLQLQI
jgi:hypothetical protein